MRGKTVSLPLPDSRLVDILVFKPHTFILVHQVFQKTSPASPRKDLEDEHESQFDYEEIEMIPESNRLRSYSTKSDYSSGSEDIDADPSDPDIKSTWPAKRRRSSASLSLSSAWTEGLEEDDSTPERRGRGRPPKKAKQAGSSVVVKDATTWSEEELNVLRDVLFANVDTGPGTTTPPFHLFPNRSKDAVRHKWREQKRRAGITSGQQTMSPQDSKSMGRKNIQSNGLPWSEAEDNIMREKMMAQSQTQDPSVCSADTISLLMNLLPGRSYKSVEWRWRNKCSEWMKGTKPLRRPKSGRTKNLGSDGEPIYDTIAEEDTGGQNNGAGSTATPDVKRRHIHPLPAKWTWEQDQLLLDKLHEQQELTASTTLAHTKLPVQVVAELARATGRKEAAVVRRAGFVSGSASMFGDMPWAVWSGRFELDKALATKRATALTPAIPSEELVKKRSNLSVESTPRPHHGRPGSSRGRWSSEEIEVFNRLTSAMRAKGRRSLGRSEAEEIASQMPGPEPRSAKACQVYYSRLNQSSLAAQPSQDAEKGTSGWIPGLQACMTFVMGVKTLIRPQQV